jgi:hypothetical protein
VGRTRGAQGEEHDDERRQRHHADLAAHDVAHHRALVMLGKRADGLRVGKVALVEDRLRRSDAQLLGDERDGKRQQRVQIEEAICRVVAGDRQRSDGERKRERGALPDAQQQPEAARPALAGGPVVPKPRAEPATALSDATTIAPATIACVMRRPGRGGRGARERVFPTPISSRLPLCNRLPQAVI